MPCPRANRIGESAPRRRARNVARALAQACLAALFACAAPLGALAAKASLQGSESGGYGRIVITFDSLPKSVMRVSNGVLVASFSEPVKLSIERLAMDMPSYISVARMDPDGKGLRLALTRNLRANKMEAGEKLFIDLLPETWKGLPPGLPQEVVDELSRRTREAESLARKAIQTKIAEEPRLLPFQIGATPTFTRIVFQPAVTSQAGMTRNGRQVAIVFDNPYSIDAERLKAGLPASVGAVSAKTEAGELTLTLDIPEEVEVKGFREDSTYAVDIATPIARTSPEASQASTVQPAGKDAVKIVPDKAQTAKSETAGSSPEVARFEPPKHDHGGQEPTDPKPSRHGPDEKERVFSQSDLSERGHSEAKTQPAKIESAKQKQQTVVEERALSEAGHTAGPPYSVRPEADLHTEASADKTPKPSPIGAGPKSVTSAPEIAEDRILLKENGDLLALALPLGPTIPLAVFERGGIVWIAAETDKALEAPAPRPAFFSAPETRRFGKLAILRLSLTRPILIRATASERGWTVTLGEGAAPGAEPLTLQREIDADGRLVVKAAYPGIASVHWVDDPETGARIAIVTGRGPARGLVKSQSFVDFKALASVQGLVIAAAAEDVTVNLGLDEAKIQREAGLSISVVPDAAISEKEAAPARPAIDREMWEEDRSGHPRLRLEELQRIAAESPKGRRGTARLALARFQIARGLAMEATGTIGAALADEPALASDRSVQMLNVAATALAGRTQEAGRLLGASDWRDDRDVDLWRAYLSARERRWPQALAGFRRADAMIERYPESLQADFISLFTEAAIEGRDFDLAQTLLERLEGLPADDRDGGRLELLRARLAEGQGRQDEALKLYDELAAGGIGPVAAEARLRKALTGLAVGSMDRKTALEELEKLSVSWRGDHLEAWTLAELGRLYAADARWRDAFATARRVNRLYPDDEAARALYEETTSRFEALFIDGKADSIARLDAIALYFDFKDFTPVGRRGDEMIRRLVERLVALDLLAEASDLLRHQVDHRLAGAAKASVAARLAIIYLMAKQPAKAQQVLRESRIAELPGDLRRARVLLEARALSDLSQTDQALDVIAPENGRDVERLKADILWHGRRWREAGELFEKLAGDRWQMQPPLDELTRLDVMRAAIAYGLGEEDLSLDRLRTKFAAKMADSADARAFAMATAPATTRGAGYRDVARSIASADTLADFLDEFRKRYPDAPKPATRARPAEAKTPEAKTPEAKTPEAKIPEAKSRLEPKPAEAKSSTEEKPSSDGKPAAESTPGKAGPA